MISCSTACTPFRNYDTENTLLRFSTFSHGDQISLELITFLSTKFTGRQSPVEFDSHGINYHSLSSIL